MPRRFVFADEAGDFNFSRGPNVSRYFIVCTVAMDSCDIAHDLLELRRRMVWNDIPVGNYFHAAEDKQEVRNSVFDLLTDHEFSVQATIMEKSKAMPKVRETKHRFYQYGWYYHFKHSLARHASNDDELFIAAASVGTKKGQAVFTSAVNDVIQQHIPRDRWRTAFWPCSNDPCLQVADYCTWAIQRKWERDDQRPFELIRNRITYEFELWRHGTRHYY